ncbi:MAG: hypothetical protein K2L02_04565 [Clostridia bacterium]|nr:hypothetical protein [Clostridia bacterium]
MAKKLGENRMNESKAKRFWRIQGECWKRMVTPYLMYLFMSMLLLATQLVGITWLEYLLGTLCILVGAAFNAHLAYTTGVTHYDAYLTGCIHRRNIEAGIASGGDHRPEREYSPWKGFYIGLLVGIPVIVFAGIACVPGAVLNSIGKFFLVMFAGFAIVPISWIFGGFEGAPASSLAWSMIMVLLPIIVTGVFYIVGAYVEKRRKKVIEERNEALQEAKNAPKVYHEQTEEQKRKTLQSKKKKK